MIYCTHKGAELHTHHTRIRIVLKKVKKYYDRKKYDLVWKISTISLFYTSCIYWAQFEPRIDTVFVILYKWILCMVLFGGIVKL